MESWLLLFQIPLEAKQSCHVRQRIMKSPCAPPRLTPPPCLPSMGTALSCEDGRRRAPEGTPLQAISQQVHIRTRQPAPLLPFSWGTVTGRWLQCSLQSNLWASRKRAQRKVFVQKPNTSCSSAIFFHPLTCRDHYGFDNADKFTLDKKRRPATASLTTTDPEFQPVMASQAKQTCFLDS